MKNFKFIFILFIIGIAALLSVASFAGRQPKVLSASIENFPVQPELPDVNDIFTKINKTRAENGLSPLNKNPELTQIALIRAADMKANNYYAHENPAGKFFYDLIKDEKYDFEYSCENLNLDFTKTSETYINSWLKSKKGHRECLLNSKTTEAGYAVVAIDDKKPAYIIVAIHGQL